MPSNLFGPGTTPERSAKDIEAAQNAARAADRKTAGAAAGRDRRSIGTQR